MHVGTDDEILDVYGYRGSTDILALEKPAEAQKRSLCVLDPPDSNGGVVYGIVSTEEPHVVVKAASQESFESPESQESFESPESPESQESFESPDSPDSADSTDD